MGEIIRESMNGALSVCLKVTSAVSVLQHPVPLASGTVTCSLRGALSYLLNLLCLTPCGISQIEFYIIGALLQGERRQGSPFKRSITNIQLSK